MRKLTSGIVLLSFIFLSACGGGGGGSDPAGTGTGTGTGTDSGTGTTPARTLTIIDSSYTTYYSNVFPATPFRGGIATDTDTLTVTKGGTAYATIPLMQTAISSCPISNNTSSTATLWAVDETRSHYALVCSYNGSEGLYIINGQGQLLWSGTTTFDNSFSSDSVYFNNGKIVVFQKQRVLSADYENNQTLSTFHTFQRESGYAGARILLTGSYPVSSQWSPVSILSDGTMVANYMDYNTDGSAAGAYTSTKRFYYVINADGSLKTKINQDNLKAGLSTVSGSEHNLNASAFGLDNNGKLNFWFPSIVDTSTGKVVQLNPDEFDLLKALENPTLSPYSDVLSCADYFNGMCATYRFSIPEEDIGNYKPACANEVSTCSTVGAGICQLPVANTTSPSGGKVSTHLYLYESHFDPSVSPTTCLGAAGGDKWIASPTGNEIPPDPKL